MRVNLGAGNRGLPSWVNVDTGTKYLAHRFLSFFEVLERSGVVNKDIVTWIRETGKPPPNLKRWDLTRPLPLEEGAASAVYCAEVLEHLREFECRGLLREIRRVLRPEGIARFSVPDLRKICSAYLGGQIDARRLSSFFYIPAQTRPGISERLGSRVYSTHYHQWMYDADSLSGLVKGAGFSHVILKLPQEGDLPDVVELERDLDEGRKYSLYLEAR